MFKRWAEIDDSTQRKPYSAPVDPGPEYYERLRREHEEYCEVNAEEMARNEALFLANNAWMMDIVRDEEEHFAKRITGADRLLNKILKPLEAAGETVIPGKDAFFLHDTHGIRIELLCNMAAEQGMTVDEAGFEKLLDEQRERSRPEVYGLNLHARGE